ncbi:hypothetical protein MLD38_006564 [Melastoma candidum]|uniref:Uncharacterized protein n=1 Tax=Melastoma candidum TaxID=119954 RepID=A0ACB9RQ63_9MYRT|nr:hypothetical protein MLD38_006564 [Melastoma candidum]
MFPGAPRSDISSIKSQHTNVKVALSLGGDVVSGAPVYFDLSNIDTSDPNIFSRCIGELITTLKNNRVISFASIAPFYTGDVQRNYMALWRDYGSVIDYVNFQFYAYPSSTTVSQFENYFNEQASNYGVGKCS